MHLLAEFEAGRRYTLLTTAKLESHLADLLETPVDLSSPEWLKESIRNQALRESVLDGSKRTTPIHRGDGSLTQTIERVLRHE